MSFAAFQVFGRILPACCGEAENVESEPDNFIVHCVRVVARFCSVHPIQQPALHTNVATAEQIHNTSFMQPNLESSSMLERKIEKQKQEQV